MTKKIQTLNVRMPGPVILWIDSLVEEGAYSSRSEAIRDMLRERLRI
ncbi:ribbon-helix-helix domain-containing protein [Candidatus Woesearchaeota archaeon]|nr:ribbon-helix-helix domain-containing protein [Candidatus Woesearchaeota archaeon]